MADAYDALTSRRSYREALALDETYRILEDGGGTQFDPVIMRVFLDLKQGSTGIPADGPPETEDECLQDATHGKSGLSGVIEIAPFDLS